MRLKSLLDSIFTVVFMGPTARRPAGPGRRGSRKRERDIDRYSRAPPLPPWQGPPEAEIEIDRERESFSFRNIYKKNSKKSAAARWKRELNARKNEAEKETNHKRSKQRVEKDVKKNESVVVGLAQKLGVLFVAAWVRVKIIEWSKAKPSENRDLCIVEKKVFKIGLAFFSSVVFREEVRHVEEDKHMNLQRAWWAGALRARWGGSPSEPRCMNYEDAQPASLARAAGGKRAAHTPLPAPASLARAAGGKRHHIWPKWITFLAW